MTGRYYLKQQEQERKPVVELGSVRSVVVVLAVVRVVVQAVAAVEVECSCLGKCFVESVLVVELERMDNYLVKSVHMLDLDKLHSLVVVLAAGFERMVELCHCDGSYALRESLISVRSTLVLSLGT